MNDSWITFLITIAIVLLVLVSVFLLFVFSDVYIRSFSLGVAGIMTAFARGRWMRLDIDPVQGESRKILIAGDSIAMSFTATDVRQTIAKQLHNKTHMGIKTVAKNGSMTDAIIGQIQEHYETYKPDYILLSAGGNDIAKRFATNIETTYKNIETLADYLATLEARVIWMAPPRFDRVPITKKLPALVSRRLVERSVLVQNKIVEVCKIAGLACIIPEDVFDERRVEFAEDSFHPKPEFNELLATVVARWILHGDVLSYA